MISCSDQGVWRIPFPFAAMKAKSKEEQKRMDSMQGMRQYFNLASLDEAMFHEGGHVHLEKY
jgi:hypothetical protein